jgi:hypothetical protein
VTIDLGIKAILDGAEAAHESDSSPPPVEAPSASDDSSPEFKQLKESGRWRELALASEKLLAEDHANLEAKLYWLIAQAESGALPRSFLMAPLDEAKAGLKSGSRPLGSENLAALALEAERAVHARTATEGVQDPALITSPEFLAAAELGRDLSVSKEQAMYSRRPKSWRNAAVACSGGALLAIAGIYTLSGSAFHLAAGIAPVSIVLPLTEPALLASEVQTSAGFGRLTALVYDIDALKVTPPSAPAPEPAAAATAAGPQVVNVGVTQQQVAPAANVSTQSRKERVRTDGPIEPEQVRNRVLGDRAPISGPLTEVSRSREDSSGYRPSASVEPGGVYQVSASTSVLSEPSAYGRVLGTLRPGDKVKVDATFGRWARLVGNRGRPGFVEIQDIGGHSGR